MSQRNPERRVPKMDNDDSFMLYRGYTLNDAMLVGGPVFLAMVALMFLPEQFMFSGLLWSGILALCGIVVAITSPDHMKSTEWLIHNLSHRFRPSTVHNVALNGEYPHREQSQAPDHPITQSLSATQRTQDVLRVDRVFPSHGQYPGVTKQRDGTMIGLVKVHPANLTLATAGQWRNATSSLATFCNTLDYKTVLYHTNRQFDVDRFLQPYRERRGDDDLRAEPALEEVHEAFLEWYPEQHLRGGTTISEHYIVVGVRKDEVKQSAPEPSGVVDQLSEQPIFNRFTDDDDDNTREAVLRGRQREELYVRLEQVAGGIQDVPDVDSEIVDAEDHSELIARAWTREEMDVDLSEHISYTGVAHHEAERKVGE
jgi:hypothetical protein